MINKHFTLILVIGYLLSGILYASAFYWLFKVYPNVGVV